MKGERGLIERLRHEPTEHELGVGVDAVTTRIWNDLCFEAADEIERLEEALMVQIEWGLRLPYHPTDRVQGALYKIRRLREALANIRGCIRVGDSAKGVDDIASTALKPDTSNV